MGERLSLEWRSFLLRPRPADPPRTLEQFRGYTESWRTAQAEEPRAKFQVWSSEEGPPSHSVPPQLISKAAARLDREQGEAASGGSGPGRWDTLHWSLLEAYFRDNRDITCDRVLSELWDAAGYPQVAIPGRGDDVDVQRELVEEIIADHQEAMQHGASGVPAVRLADSFGVVVGAQPTAAYRQWIEKILAAAGS